MGLRTHDGPVVDGKPTTVSIFSMVQLSGSSYLPSLFHLINVAFDGIHLRRLPPMEGGYPPRLDSPEEILSQLRDDPQTFMFILSFADKPEEILATASCRPYLAREGDGESPWARRLGPEEQCVEWEYKLLAVDPKYQGNGLAVYLTKLTEEEAVRRSKAALANAEKTHGGTDARRVRMVLVGLKETTNDFYLRQGYKNDYEIPGVAGWPVTVVSMSKVIAEL
jgi:GNAT superfamily N-acetyltransferase